MTEINTIISSAIKNWEIEIRRGVIVLLVLAGLMDEDLHGMALIEKIATGTGSVIDVPLGTIYPLLRRFNQDGMIETYKANDDARKTMYRLNKNGKVFLIKARDLWLRYSSATHKFMDNIDERYFEVAL
ncbi:MAG: PadR family transcriptional regulator [Candidatus Heimdallarchaeota archaeon]|nr:PadR family transcriptional regulator [Candidatus Heimdallarchaeota archaeon]